MSTHHMDVDVGGHGATSLALLVFGANESGQLGLEPVDSIPSPMPSLRSHSEVVTAVAFGLCHALWLTSEGMVVVSGLNDVGARSSHNRPGPTAAVQRLSWVPALLARAQGNAV